MFHLRLLAACTTALVCCSGTLPVVAQSTDLMRAFGQCSRKNLTKDERPGWTVSGSWISNSELALVDALNGRILRYNADGRMIRVEPDPLRSMLEKEVGTAYPFAVASPDHSNLWIELNADNLVKVTASGALVARLPLNQLELDNGKVIDGVFAWDVAGDTLVGFANLRDPGDREDATWTTGFFRVPLATPSAATLIGQELPDPSPEKFWYRLGMDFLASINDTTYVITVNGKFELSKIEPAHNNLTSVSDLPAGVRELPVLPEFKTVDDMVKLARGLEGSTIPAGLHTWGEELFLLWRTPGEHGTEWYLTNLSTTDGKPQGTARLPTKANHLTLVAGEKYWALVEKGPVMGFAAQKVESIAFLPTEELGRIKGSIEIHHICPQLDRGNGGGRRPN